MTEIHVCAQCMHYREKALVNPFQSNRPVWTPDVLEAKTKWDQEQDEIALLEKQRFEANEEFDYEPNYYPWCEYWTQKEDRFVIDPVKGSKTPIYVLCAQGNPDGQCEMFTPKE